MRNADGAIGSHRGKRRSLRSPSPQERRFLRIEQSGEAPVECDEAIAFGAVGLVPNDTIGKIAGAREHRDPCLDGRTFDFDRADGNKAVQYVDDLRGGVAILGKLARYVIALGTTALVTGLLYYFGPNRNMKLRTVWPGAFLTTALWLLATLGFAWYVRHIANYNVLYEGIGAVIVLLIWMYLLAAITLFGCEFNAEL